tara:strand:- start:354 stop:551 length:198 start_codon:yes stop_codon:yes gene_type:complete
MDSPEKEQLMATGERHQWPIDEPEQDEDAYAVWKEEEIVRACEKAKRTGSAKDLKDYMEARRNGI